MNKDELKELLKAILIGKVLAVLKHPYADKLNLVVLDLGGWAKVVITGASNIKDGDLVPYLGEKNIVPGYLLLHGEKVVLGKKMLRGLQSDSMILAEDEIGIGSDHSGIYIINSENSELLGKSILEVISEDQLEKMLASQSKESHF